MACLLVGIASSCAHPEPGDLPSDAGALGEVADAEIDGGIGGEVDAGIDAPPPDASAAVLPAPPASPGAYTLPATATRVRNTSELLAAIAEPTARDIVLESGTYSPTATLDPAAPHRLWSATPGGATITAGIVFGSNFGDPGGELHGLRFDVSDPSRTFQNAIVNVWGVRTGVRILDCWFDGHRVIGAAILARQPEGLVVERVVVSDFVDFGIFADANDPERTLTTPVRISDADIRGVSRAVPRSSDGTAEAGLWLGNTGIVERVRVRDAAWMGIWTGTNCNDARFSDLDIDATPTGIYIEHFTRRSVFERLHIGNGVSVGVNSEWADPDWGALPGGYDNTFRTGTYESSRFGIYLDDGTVGTIVRDNVFRGQRCAAIGHYRTVGTVIGANDFSGLPAGAMQVSTAHANACAD